MINVEIWSDVVCPFCYIGKRKFEQALSEFPLRDQVNVVWRSFELDPGARPKPGQTLTQTLAHKYGQSEAWAEQMQQGVAASAAQVGLNFQLHKALPVNTFDAHRLIHLATQHGLQDVAEERLFKAYFEEGADIGNREILVKLGSEIGLHEDEISRVLDSEQFSEAVRRDESEAQTLGIRGVPFFVLNNKYGISGAQPKEVFLEALQQVWNESKPLEMDGTRI